MQNVTCEYCSKSMPNDPGSYYHRKACEATWLASLLEKTTDPNIQEEIKRRLELARYTGD